MLSVIRGTDLADQYVIVGAHYDHLGVSCRTRTRPTRSATAPPTTPGAPPASPRSGDRPAIAGQPTRPRRSVILALWDREEDGLLGSQYYASTRSCRSPTIVAYVNFDIQGANLLPSLRDTSFAVGAEGGGPLQNIVRAAAGRGRWTP